MLFIEMLPLIVDAGVANINYQHYYQKSGLIMTIQYYCRRGWISNIWQRRGGGGDLHSQPGW